MLKLKKFTKKNLTKKYISWLNDTEFMQYSRHKKSIFNFKKCEKFYNEIKIKKNLFFAIYFKNKHVGNIIAYMDFAKKKAEISILTTKSGTGLKSYKKLIIILKKLNINQIYSGTNLKNIKMIKLCKKLNMRILKKNKNSIFYSKNI